jgi:hypothetical protein
MVSRKGIASGWGELEKQRGSIGKGSVKNRESAGMQECLFGISLSLSNPL